ncbi:isoprenylcysteine carboxylmethyltransferase family protein [Bremerella sp.]|uniref:isoprenylcysteine carboxylmethyltransferase family protein n=1 Tax=Bremerella sp. TaxID=2795602 RepID=UPI00391DB04B
MPRSWPGRMATFTAGHVLHLILIVLPTLLLTGIDVGQISVMLFVVLIGAAGLIESLLVSPPERQSEQDPLALQVAALVGLTMLLMFWTAQVESWLTEPQLWPLSVLGVGLMIMGIALRASALYALGPRFISDISCDAPPVSVGIYRYLRHPSEVGLLTIAVGGPLVLQAPWTALIAGSILLPISAWRIRREDNVLAQAMN